MTVTEVRHTQLLRLRAEVAAVRRAAHPYWMAETHAWAASGTHIFSRHPELRLSLCSNITRPTRHMALEALRLPAVTCDGCLTEFAVRVGPR
jgi:hypothetical protein